MANKEIPVKEIGEMMDMMSSKLPGMLKDVQQAFFSEEAALNMSKAVGVFYKNLLEAGMDKDSAMYLTQEYMGTLKSLAGQFKQS